MDKKICAKCGDKIPEGIAYLPGIGEVCMACFKNYAMEQENTQIATSKSTKG